MTTPLITRLRNFLLSASVRSDAVLVRTNIGVTI
jgi:hypothetical protein